MSSRIRWIFCTFWPTGTFLVVRLSVCLLPDLSWALPILFAIESPLIADQRSHSECCCRTVNPGRESRSFFEPCFAVYLIGKPAGAA